ncbi:MULTISPECIES: YuzF family protein [Priestia]|uniref:YuzF family protein n=1 Tax=Priestia TaxID=2800373 RepID=UPI001C8DD1B3|nr:MULTISPECIES: YuzF family protein [Priestia]MBY0061685.1 YuzF family protein [Priestia aryabhattai]MCQ9283892.1 YuzF family protein [Priestia aryabhattai]WKU21823.1 YuzF family protein [Priestia megaterium]
MSYEEDERNYETPSMVTHVDPYVYATLQSVQGKDVVIETVRGSVRGRVKDVKIDHVVIAAKSSTFFVRIQQIVWIMPE